MGGAGLGVSVFRSLAPSGATRPYLTVDEAMSLIPDLLEDGAASTIREHVTVYVWMDWKNLGSTAINTVQPGGSSVPIQPGALMESYTLPGLVVKALQGSRLMTSGTGAPPTTVYATIVRNAGPRLLQPDDNIVRYPIWLEIWRAI